MPVSAKIGERTYEFAYQQHLDAALLVWDYMGGDDQESFEVEMTARGVDYSYCESTYVDEILDEAAAREMANQRAYIESQFDRLTDRYVDYPLRMQLKDNAGGQTNWLNLTWEQAVAIKEILKGG